MAKVLKHRRGTAEEHTQFIGAEGEFTMDTTNKTIVVHDGVTPGGIPLATQAELNFHLENLSGVVKSVNGVSPDGSGNVSLTITNTWADLQGKPSSFPPASHSHDYLPLGGGTCWGTIYAPAFQISSDKRLKSDIKPIENSVKKVLELSGYTYIFNGLDGRQAGVIAQEVEGVLPEAIKMNDEGYKTVNYSALVALMVNAIKELKGEIDDLRFS